MHAEGTKPIDDNPNVSSIRPIDEIRNEKLKKLEEIKALGINPYPATLEFDIISMADARKKALGEGVSVAGRITSVRAHGGISFADIQDRTGKFQLAFKKENMNEQQAELFKLIDASDFIEVTGPLFTTNAGEVTVDVQKFNLLGKAIRPVPDKPDKDKELRIRKRYVDLLTNEDSRRVFSIRHKLIRGVRNFLDNKGNIEVETPILQPLYGGSNAQPFTTHINSIDAEAYLRIAPELYLKRLVVAGYEGVYEFAKNFRNEGIDQTHFPEFTMLELYLSYTDYHGMMDLMEEMMRYLSSEVLNMPVVKVHEQEIDLRGQWRRIAMTDLILEELGIDVTTLSYKELAEYAEKSRLEFEANVSKGELIFLVFDKLIAKTLIDPTWVIDYPIEVSPLSKAHRSKEGFTERFELYIGGVELMDGWSEITDAAEQRARFEADARRKFDETETAQPLDEDFLEAMEYGLPPFAGVGSGIDRLVMFFSNTWTIQDCILFPYKKPLQRRQPSKALEIKQSTDGLPTRDEAIQLLEEHVFDEYQHIHAKMVANVLEFYAKHFDEDVDLWYVTGILHDLDFNTHPAEHPDVEIGWFKEWGYPDQLIHAIEAHAHKRTGVEPQSKLAQALVATDEVAGIMYAYAILRPEGFTGMKVSSFRKKLKDKAFAPSIDRAEVQYGLERFEIDDSEHFANMIEVFQGMEELHALGTAQTGEEQPDEKRDDLSR